MGEGRRMEPDVPKAPAGRSISGDVVRRVTGAATKIDGPDCSLWKMALKAVFQTVGDDAIADVGAEPIVEDTEFRQSERLWNGAAP